MSQASLRRLLSGVSLIALTATASAGVIIPPGVQPAQVIIADTDSVDATNSTILADGNGDSLVVLSTVTIADPAATAVTLNNTDLVGTFVNNGSITAAGGDGIHIINTSQLLGGFVNDGFISGTSDGFDFEDSTFAGGFTNNGVINAGLAGGTRAAIEVDDSSIWAGGITNTGVLSGELGIDVRDGSIFSGGIDNRASGSITGDGTAGIRATGVGTTFDGGIQNAGAISGGEGGYGIFIDNTLFEDGVTNLSGGTITGDGNIALYIAPTTFSGGVFNTGVIDATGAQAVHISGTNFSGGIDNQNYIAASGATALYVDTANFAGTINNSGEIDSDVAGIVVATAVPGGIVTSGNIIAPTAIDIFNSSGGPVIQQTGGNIIGNIQMCGCGDSFFEGSGGYFQGTMLGTSVGDDLTVTGGTWAAQGAATDMNDITTIGIGVFGGQFRGDLAGTGFDITSDTFSTTLGRAYLDDDTLVSTGTQTYGAGGVLEYFLTTSEATHGRVNSGGAANLDGRLAAYFDWNSFAGSADQTRDYINVINSGGLVGAFDNEGSLDTNSIFFTATATHFAGIDVDIHATRIGFDELLAGPTANQAALGSALETIFVGGGANFLTLEDPFGNGLQNPQTDNEGLFSALFQSATPSDYAAALSTLDGHIYGQVEQATFNIDDLFDELIRGRLTSAHASLSDQYWSSASGPQYASAVLAMSDGSSASAGGNPGVTRGRGPWSIWARGAVQSGQFDGDANAEGFDQDISALGGGVDYAFSGHTIAGLAVQYATTELDFDRVLAFVPPSHADIDSWQIAGYVSHGFGRLYLDGTASVTFNDNETQRFDAFGQPISAQFDSTVYSVYGELGTIFGDERNVRFRPYVGVGYRHADFDSFTEVCPVTCLTVDPDNSESLYSALGLAISKTYNWGSTPIMPELRASWTHEFADDQHDFQSAFIDIANVPFAVTGSTFDRDRFNVGANATAGIAQGLEVFAGYRYSVAGDFDSHTGAVGVRATW